MAVDLNAGDWQTYAKAFPECSHRNNSFSKHRFYTSTDSNKPPMAVELPLIKVVGISASGKSTLVKNLRRAGYNARPVSQEHSHVPSLWQQFDRTSVLIYLDIDLEGQRQRRPDVTWEAAALLNEQERLMHAREHADLKINTTNTEAETVLKVAVAFLQNQRVRHANEPLAPIAATGSALIPAPDAIPELQPATKRKRPKKKRRKLSDAADDTNLISG